MSMPGRPKGEYRRAQHEGAPVNASPFGWLHIVRLGLVQAALGSIVVLTTSTLNRVMVVELALPARWRPRSTATARGRASRAG